MFTLIEWLTKNKDFLNKLSYWLGKLPRKWEYFFCNVFSFLVCCVLRIFAARFVKKCSCAQKVMFPDNAFSLKDYVTHILYTFYEVVIEEYRPPDYIIQEEHFLDNALKKGNGVILYSAHVGNFIHFGTYFLRNYDCLVVVTAGSKELRPLYEQYMAKSYNLIDYDATDPVSLVRVLREHLKKNGIILLMGDFFRPQFKDTILFGLDTKCPCGAAYLSIKMDTDIMPCYSIRNDAKNHVIKIHQPVNIKSQFSIKKLKEATNYLNQYLEKMIADDPKQWFYWFEVDLRFRNTMFC